MKFLDLLFPQFCCLCNTFGSYLCNLCAQSIVPFTMSICPHCDRPSDRFQPHPCCKTQDGLDGLIICTLYNEPIRELIHRMKYSGFCHLHTFFAPLIQERLKLYQPPLDILCPIPLHPRKLKERGFNQAELIANLLSEQTGVPVRKDTLYRLSDDSSQAEKGRVERLDLQQCFTCQKPLECSGKQVGIVDDVATTGTTLRHASRALKKAGALKTWGIVLAHPY